MRTLQIQALNMKFIRKFFGLKPKIGDPVSSYLDFGIRYKGVVIETRYGKDEAFPGAYVHGEIIISTHWRGVVIEENPRFFVSQPRLLIS